MPVSSKPKYFLIAHALAGVAPRYQVINLIFPIILVELFLVGVSRKKLKGKAVRFYDDVLAGRVMAMNVMYATCEGICTTATETLKKVHSALGKYVGRDVFMYSLPATRRHAGSLA